MSSLLSNAFKVLLQVLAGVGVAGVLDKVAADKVPNYPGPVVPELVPGSPGFNLKKLIVVVIAFVIAAVVLTFIGKRLRIPQLKILK